MITQKNIIYGTFTAITAAGEDATCWLDEDNDGAGGTLDVRIFHSDSGIPAFTEATKGKRVYKSSGNNDVMLLEADNILDVYYAVCINEGATAILSVDAL